MTLKEFLEAVERRLAEFSAAQLRGILLALAAATPAKERQAFLMRLQEIDEAGASLPRALNPEGLLSDIDGVVDELLDRMEHTEDWYEWDEDDSLGPYEVFVEPLTELFERTAALFDLGQRALAREAYARLFEVFGFEDGYGRGVQAWDLPEIEINEACGRYLRAVYKTESPDRRPVALFEEMSRVRSWWNGRRPTLRDIIEISTTPLPDRDRFLADWIAFLRKQPGPDADAWLREAIGLLGGTKDLEELARSEGRERPRAYLDWLAALAEEGRHREVLAGARDALRALPPGLPIRAAIADFLCLSAAELGDRQAVASGLWEAFLAKPSLARLLALVECAPTAAARRELARRAAQHLEGYLAQGEEEANIGAGWEDELDAPAWPDKRTLAHAYLLAEDWARAHRLAAAHGELGWSSAYNPQGLVVPFFLVLFSGSPLGNLPANLAQLWRWGLEEGLEFDFWEEEEKKAVLSRLERCYAELIAQGTLSLKEQILSWCLNVAEKHVHAIVGGKRRKSYYKAATLAAACAEVLELRQNAREAKTWLGKIRDHYPRHRAFQAELDAAVHRMGRGLRG